MTKEQAAAAALLIGPEWEPGKSADGNWFLWNGYHMIGNLRDVGLRLVWVSDGKVSER